MRDTESMLLSVGDHAVDGATEAEQDQEACNEKRGEGAKILMSGVKDDTKALDIDEMHKRWLDCILQILDDPALVAH
jgi:hypothetical protein